MRTYGTLRLKGGKWVLEAEPHVIMRAKRVFLKLSKQSKIMKLSDTVDICRDLAWFMERYPLDMSEADRAHLEQRESTHRERETLVARILAGQVKSRPVETALPLRTYQQHAVQLFLTSGSLLLADDMGLGKSASAIGALTDVRCRPAVVVTKTVLPKQWEAEFRKFAPKLTTHIIKKATPYDVTAVRGRRRKKDDLQVALPGLMPDVLIMPYSKLAGWAEHLAELGIQCVVWDEVQDLRRGEKSAKGAAGLALARNVTYRLALSGTPIYNLGHEMYPVIQAVCPDALGQRKEFLEEWCHAEDGQGRAQLANPKAFGAYLREQGLMLRRNKQDVGLETPDVVRHLHTVELDDEPLADIQSAASNLAQIILGGQKNFDRMRAAGEMDQLVRQATGVAKAPYVAEFVKLLIENDEQVVLWGWHHAVYDIWRERLKKYFPAFITGSESANQKNGAKERFVAGKSRVLVMSLRSGEGIDGLQYACRTGVFGELDWSPAAMEQCLTRIDRPGQEKLVNAYYLVADEGSDPIVSDVLQLKRSQVEGVREPKKDAVLKYEVDGNRIKELAKRYLDKTKILSSDRQTMY